MLSVRNIEVIYSKVILVLRGVSLDVGEGRIVALLGANGAGKTTTLKAISGLLSTELGEVSHGEILFEGRRIHRQDPESIAAMGIRQVIEGRRLYPHLSVEENLRLGGHLGGVGRSLSERIRSAYGYFPKLQILRRRTSGYLSGGEQQMLVIARSLMGNPKLLLLDEPSLGLAPLLVGEIFQIIRQINGEEGVGILLVEQNARAALAMAHYAFVMEGGRIVLDGPADKVRENEDIREFYLGLTGLGERKSYHQVKHYKRRKRWLG